jgi:hypothetical protein
MSLFVAATGFAAAGSIQQGALPFLVFPRGAALSNESCVFDRQDLPGYYFLTSHSQTEKTDALPKLACAPRQDPGRSSEGLMLSA